MKRKNWAFIASAAVTLTCLTGCTVTNTLGPTNQGPSEDGTAISKGAEPSQGSALPRLSAKSTSGTSDKVDASKDQAETQAEPKAKSGSSEDRAPSEGTGKKVLKDPRAAAAAELQRVSPQEKGFIQAIDAAAGTDPRAVVEAGQEACQRLEYLKRVDSSVIVGALAGAEIPHAAEAIQTLCPDFSNELRRAKSGFADGPHKVGAKSTDTVILPGSYVAYGPTAQCTWSVTDATGATLEKGGAGVDDNFRMTVNKRAAKVQSTGCYAWLPAGES